MYCVFWVEDGQPQNQMETELGFALGLCEQKRKNGHRFVTMVSENPDSVGKPGVDVTGSDYDWVKRRTTDLRKDVPKLIR